MQPSVYTSITVSSNYISFKKFFRMFINSWTDYKVCWNEKHLIYKFSLYLCVIVINKLLCTIFTWSVHFHMCAIGGLENIEMKFNFRPICSVHSTYKCWPIFLQCFYIRDNIFYISPKDKVHRCDICWAGRQTCETPSPLDQSSA